MLASCPRRKTATPLSSPVDVSPWAREARSLSALSPQRSSIRVAARQMSISGIHVVKFQRVERRLQDGAAASELGSFTWARRADVEVYDEKPVSSAQELVGLVNQPGDRQREWRSDEAGRDDRGRERAAQQARSEPGFQRDRAAREQHRKGVGKVIGLPRSATSPTKAIANSRRSAKRRHSMNPTSPVSQASAAASLNCSTVCHWDLSGGTTTFLCSTATRPSSMNGQSSVACYKARAAQIGGRSPPASSQARTPRAAPSSGECTPPTASKWSVACWIASRCAASGAANHR